MPGARERILETAARLFAGRGYELVGINELIATSGVAKATFYQHFRSKEKLCAEWLRREAARSVAAGEAILASPVPARRKVAGRFDALGDFLAASDYRGCPFSNTATVVIGDSEVREAVSDYKSSARSFWHAVASEMHRPPAATKALGDALFLLYSGAVTEAQNARAIWPVVSAKKAALALCDTPFPTPPRIRHTKQTKKR